MNLGSLQSAGRDWKLYGMVRGVTPWVALVPDHQGTGATAQCTGPEPHCIRITPCANAAGQDQDRDSRVKAYCYWVPIMWVNAALSFTQRWWSLLGTGRPVHCDCK